MSRNTVLAALSLANLWYARVWSELLTYTRSDAYLMKTPPRPVEYLAVMLNVLVLAAVFIALSAAASRLPAGRWRNAARTVYLVALIVPLNALREILAAHIPYLKSPLIDLVGFRGALAIAAIVGVAVLTLLVVRGAAVVRISAALLVILSPFCAVTFAQGIWRANHYNDVEFRNLPAPPALSGTRPRARAIWFICDEWDYRLTFPARDRSLQLPEIDRLRSATLFATNAYPPGSSTPESIPSYYVGRMFSPVWQTGPRGLQLFPKGQDLELDWSREPNIFDRARAAGFETALLEWYHPTCRMLGNLDHCEWWPLARQYNSMGDTLSEITVRQTRSLFETSLFSLFGRGITADEHALVYHQMMAAARRVVVNPEYGLVVVHLPIPHNPFMYDRRTGTFTLSNSPVHGYIDHLALLDRSLADLRRQMEQAGLWDSSTVLFTSDHENRQAQELDGGYDTRIPFLLKLPGQNRGVSLTANFNTVATGDLLMKILAGEISTPEQAADFLTVSGGVKQLSTTAAVSGGQR